MAREDGAVAGRLVGLLLFTAALVAIVLLAGRLLQKKQSSTRTFPGAPHHLVVSVQAGTVTVVGSSGDDTVVHRTLTFGFRKPSAGERSTSDGVHVDGACPRYSLAACRVAYRIEVPRDEAVDVRTTAGSVRVTAVTGSVKLRATAGSIAVDSVEGDVDLTTSAGSISGVRIRSEDVKAHTAAGSVSLRFDVAPDHVDASAEAGSVALDLVDAVYAVDTSTRAGSTNVDVQTNSDATRTIKASTGAGSIRIAKHAGLR